MFLRRVVALLCLAQALAAAQLPPPLPHVQNLGPLGSTLVLRQARCWAEGQPETLGRLYLRPLESGQYRVVRTEYNEQGKWVLERGKTDSAVSRYYRKYVLDGQPLSLTTFDLLLGLWRAFGFKFTLDGRAYHCRTQ